MLNVLVANISWINIAQLNILGVKMEYLYFIAIFVIVLILNIIIKPILIWLINKKFMVILSYITSSLIVLIMSFIFIFTTNYFTIIFIKYVLYAIAFFGVFLIITLTYSRFKKET